MSYLWSWLYGSSENTNVVSQNQLENVTLKQTGRLEDLIKEFTDDSIESTPAEVQMPARFLPESLKGKPLNSQTIPRSTLVVTQKDLNEVKLKKTMTRATFKFFIHPDPIVIEFKAAGMIRMSRRYKKETGERIREGLDRYFSTL